jgi:thiol-disulfide isomerase/thioredoxin
MLVVALLVLLGASRALAAGSVQLDPGAAAPAISAPTARGPFDSTTSGRPYLVEFFAVWCPHCQREVPVMNAIEKADGDRIDVIAVPASPFGFDHTSTLTDADLQTFAQRFHTTYRIGFDGFFSSSYDYGVASFPAIYVVGADRHVVAVENGEVPVERLQADIDRALAPRTDR